jgi:hypothetical protein
MLKRILILLKYFFNICETKIKDESLEEPLLKYCENDSTNEYLLQKSEEMEQLNHLYPIIEEHV